MAVKLLGHRLHPILITFPIGLLGGSLVFDIAYLATDSTRWSGISFWLLIAGVVSGLIAAPFGTLDWLSIANGTRAKRIGLFHGATAIVSLAIFSFSAWLRHGSPTSPDTSAFAWSFVAGALLLLAGWLGGELVERLGVGVDPGAHADSPNSLTGLPASHSSSLAAGSKAVSNRT